MIIKRSFKFLSSWDDLYYDVDATFNVYSESYGEDADGNRGELRYMIELNDFQINGIISDFVYEKIKEEITDFCNDEVENIDLSEDL